MQRRVAVITPGTFPLPSAQSSSVEQTVHHISQQLKHELQYEIFSKKTKPFTSVSTDAGITYRRIVRRRTADYLAKISRRLRTFRPHLIQVENRPRFVLQFKRRFPSTPVWLSLHSTRYISMPHIKRSQLAKCLRKADKIVVNSHFLSSYVQSLCSGLSDKIIVNHLGIDPDQFSPFWTEEGMRVRQQMRAELGYEGKKIVMYAGRLIPEKGVHFLLRAIPEIAREHSDVVFLIVGSAFYGSNRITPYVKSLHRIGNQHPKHVRFIPFVPHDEMSKWYQMADIAVVPSQGNEAFGLTNVEAMACGLPVVAARTGGMTEIIVDGETGFFVDVGDAGVPQLASRINQLLHQHELRKKMGEKARRWAEQNFTWELAAARMLEAYKTEWNESIPSW